MSNEENTTIIVSRHLQADFSVVIHKTSIHKVCTDTHAGLRLTHVQINTSHVAYNVMKLKITHCVYQFMESVSSKVR